jgi:hypothetical protein
MRAVLPVMRAQASGVIINVSSINARMSANPGVAVYGMSKQALSFLSESCREEVAAFGIRVVAAEPGLVATPTYEKNRPTIGPSSPYAGLLTNVDENVSKSIADGYPPSDTAAGIVAIVEDPEAPARVLVGRTPSNGSGNRPPAPNPNGHRRLDFSRRGTNPQRSRYEVDWPALSPNARSNNAPTPREEAPLTTASATLG